MNYKLEHGKIYNECCKNDDWKKNFTMNVAKMMTELWTLYTKILWCLLQIFADLQSINNKYTKA